MTRGIRNNNPGNIRKSATKWAGLSDQQPDPDFCTFRSPEYGIRAICRILLTYHDRGVDTVRQIISTWAPPSENDTASYIDDVAANCEVGPDDPIDVDQARVMRELVRAIIYHENGSCPYSDAVITDGMRLAGISDVPIPPMMASKTSQGVSIASVGTGMAVATETVRQLSTVRDTVDQARDLVQWAVCFGPWIAVAFIAAGIALAMYDHMRKRQRLGV